MVLVGHFMGIRRDLIENVLLLASSFDKQAFSCAHSVLYGLNQNKDHVDLISTNCRHLVILGY